MGYLLAKIVVLLVLAALLGAWLMRWWLMRQLTEVTSEYRTLTGDWAAWRKRVESLLVPVPPAPLPPPTDLQPVLSRLDAVESTMKAAVGAIRIPAIPPMPVIPAPVTVDLGPLQARLAELERAWKGFTVPEPKDVDFSGVIARLEQLGAAVRAIRIPPPAPPPPPKPSAPSAVRAGSRNLLSHAAYGRPDDLQLIKGVAKVLEKMMHGIGVYYFWQIAEWTPADVEHADKQLSAFHGRIERDNWIDQSIVLATRPDSQRRPEGP